MGSDFPPALIPLIKSWETSVILRVNESRLTTRGWNGYDAAQNRVFKYLTPKLRLEVADLEEHPALLLSRSFHLICSPLRCISLVSNLLRLRKRLSPLTPKPLIIWEPVPDLCVPSELLNLTNCLSYIDICSPNHTELLRLLDDPRSNGSGSDSAESFDAAAIEAACEQLLAAMPLQTFALVVRCGAHGVYIAKNGGRSRRPSRRPSPSGRARQKRPANHARGGLTPDTDMEALFAGFDAEFDRGPYHIDPGTSIWLPPYFVSQEGETDLKVARNMGDESEEYHLESPGARGIIFEAPTPVEASPSPKILPQGSITVHVQPQTESQFRIVDPTGAGNSFLGALSVALTRGKSLEEAACWGNIAAGFLVEQVGVPVLSAASASGAVVADGQGELWNGDSVWERLNSYLERVRGVQLRD